MNVGFLKSCNRGLVVGSLASVGMLGLARPASAAINLLSNPGFEAGVAGSPDASATDQATSAGGSWSGYNNWVTPFSGFYTSSVAHGGTQSVKTFSAPNGGVYQSVAITAGHTYTASAYFDNRSGGDLLTGGATDDLRLTFFDANSNNQGVFVSPTVVSASTPTDTWTQLTVTATAPAGAATVDFRGFFNGGGGGALYMDDASLTDTTPTPEPALLSSLGLLGVAAFSRRRAKRA